MSDPKGLAIARQLIATEAQQQTGFLDLGNLGLTELPEEIHQLSHLRILNLGYSYYDPDGEYHSSVNRLYSYIFYTPLPSLHFPLLKVISLSTMPMHDLSPLAGLTSLESLDCSATKVTDLSPVSSLTKLRLLCCWTTSVSDLSPLAGLTKLQTINCAITKVRDLSPLSQLRELQLLRCDQTSVSDLTPLVGLPNLNELDASRCTLSSFPTALLSKRSLFKLNLYETRIPGVPAEVLSQSWGDDCRQRLLDHVNDLEAGAEPVADVKVIVIGNGRIGKTQICNRLRGEHYEEDADSTHGITVTQTEFPMSGDSQPAMLNLWDFGGQDLYHGTHALFLKSRALFVVVWTPTAETNSEYEHGGVRFRNQPLSYWLDYVRHAAGRVCPVVLVQNQCDTARDEVLQPPVDAEVLWGFPYLQQTHYSARVPLAVARVPLAVARVPLAVALGRQCFLERHWRAKPLASGTRTSIDCDSMPYRCR